MPTCPACLAKYPGDVLTCKEDGETLVPDETYASVDHDLVAGATVGEYVVEAKLGQGGFGAVYRAVHPLIGKRAAVKVLGRQFSSNPQMVSRFVAEARAVNQIRHRNIIDIFSFGALPDGRQYYIMELLDGMSFDAYLDKRKRLSLAEALPILRGVARALDAAHGKGILHRDLKPENIFLVFDDDGRVEPKLLDFGLVKLLSPLPAPTSGGADPGSGSARGSDNPHKTKTGTPMGTPYYMSPEQCRGLDVDTRTDVYSFGALVFEILTGSVPYQGTSTIDILVKHMTSPIPSASDRCADVPAAVDSPIARMLAKEAGERPSRVGEALELLARSAGLDPTTTSHPSLPFPPAPLSDDERAIARTVIADPSSLPPSGSGPPARVQGQTFLATESTISAAPAPGRGRLIAAVIAGAAIVGFVGFFALRPRPVAPAASTPSTIASPLPSPSPSPLLASPSSEPATPPASTDVELRVEGAPPGTTVAADGVELGAAPGPFKLARGKPVKVTLTAKGYKTKELAVAPTADVLLPVSLDKAPGAGGPAPAKRPPAPGATIHSDLDAFDNKK